MRVLGGLLIPAGGVILGYFPANPAAQVGAVVALAVGGYITGIYHERDRKASR